MWKIFQQLLKDIPTILGMVYFLQYEHSFLMVRLYKSFFSKGYQKLSEWIIDTLTFSYGSTSRTQVWKSVTRAYEIPDYISDSMLRYQ